MEYKIYKFAFSTGVHFGKRNLEDSEIILHSDTIFSALCNEAIKQGQEVLNKLYDIVKTEEIVLSDAFPYINKTYFLPKPLKYIEHAEVESSQVREKDYKKLKYIPFDEFNNYLSGKMNVKKVANMLKDLGKSEMRMSADVSNFDESKPYRVGVYNFNENNGLYMIIGYNSEDNLELIEDLLLSLSYTGIGGKRSSGLGKFVLNYGKMDEEIINRLTVENEMYMTISSSLPKDDEIEESLVDAQYLLMKRSGFVYSENYSTTQLRKKDLYVYVSGSCFRNKYSGDVYDVSNCGTHPVYKYAKPMFLGVDK